MKTIKLAKVKDEDIVDVYETLDSLSFANITHIEKYVYVGQDTIENAIGNHDYNLFLLNEKNDFSVLYYEDDMMSFEKLTMELLNDMRGEQ